MDTETISQSHTSPETSESDQANVEKELDTEFAKPKLNDFKETFQKGFSKNTPYINWRRNAQKRVSERLAKGLYTSCKSQLHTGSAPHHESVGSVVEMKGQEQSTEDIIEGRVEEEISAVDEISMINDHISDNQSEKTLAGSDEDTIFEFEAELHKIEASTELDKKEETEDNASTEDPKGSISTITKGGSEIEDTHETVAPDTIIPSPNSQGSTERDGSTVESSETEQSEGVAVEKADELDPISEEDLDEIEQENILLAVVIFLWTSVRDFFVDSKYFLSKCTLPDSHGIAILR
jgi:hypothetical protein